MLVVRPPPVARLDITQGQRAERAQLQRGIRLDRLPLHDL